MEEIDIISYIISTIFIMIIAILVFNEYAKTKEKDIELKQAIIDYYKRGKKGENEM